MVRDPLVITVSSCSRSSCRRSSVHSSPLRCRRASGFPPDVQPLAIISSVSPMVNKLVEDSTLLDRTYAALADPTRRALLVSLREGDARISDLAAPMPMSFAAVSRHVGGLEDAGLVKRKVRGREHWLTV